MYKLYYHPLNASMAPHLVLEELGVDYELIFVNRELGFQRSAEYLALNPTGRIPTLIDGDLAIFESAAICLHLCDKHPDVGLMPGIAHSDRARFYQWLMYLISTVQPELMIYFYPEMHTTVPESVASIADVQESRVTEMLSLLDKQLEGKDYLVGNSVTVCDFFLFMLLVWADEFKKPPLSFPHLSRFLRSVSSRPTVKRVCEKEGLSLDAYV